MNDLETKIFADLTAGEKASILCEYHERNKIFAVQMLMEYYSMSASQLITAKNVVDKIILSKEEQHEAESSTEQRIYPSVLNRAGWGGIM